MPETFHAALDAPVVEIVAGQEITLPVLTVDDLLLWAAQLKAQRKAADAKRLAPNSDPFTRFRAEKYSDENEPAIDELASLSRSPAGAKKVLLLSLAKAKHPDPEAVVRAVPPWRLASLAADVSRLFPPAYGYAETPDPNPRAGEGAGASTGPGSPEPSAATPGNV